MIVVVAMISALKFNMVCILIPFSTRVHSFSRRASVASEKKFGGFPGILANVQGKIGAPYRDMTQIGWQVCDYIALTWGKDFYQGGHCPPMPPPWRRPWYTRIYIWSCSTNLQTKTWLSGLAWRNIRPTSIM